MVYSNTAICGGNEYGKSGHLYIFVSLKQLVMLLKCTFSGVHFALYHWQVESRSLYLKIFKVETLLNNAFKGIG